MTGRGSIQLVRKRIRTRSSARLGTIGNGVEKEPDVSTVDGTHPHKQIVVEDGIESAHGGIESRPLGTEVKVKLEICEDETALIDVDSSRVTNNDNRHVNSKKKKIRIKSETLSKQMYEPFPTNPLQVFPKKEDDSPANIFKKAVSFEIDTIIDGEGDKQLELAPENWIELYNRVVEMRSKFIAPVDTMGCERIPEQIDPNIRYSYPKVFRFQLLISLLLSSQTKDEVNYEAVLRMNHYFKERGYIGLCIEGVLETTESVIDSLIQKVGFHNKKASYMKKSCELLKERFNSDVPKSITEIVMLPGVGPKMGYLLLYKAWDISDGIGVDVHLHRLSTMWKWAPKSTNPESTRLALQKWLPRRYWADINPLFVGFGQMICLPKGNKCDLCSLATAGLCSNVNRKVAKLRGDPKRMLEVGKGRGDLSLLIEDIKQEALIPDIEDI